MSSLEREIRPLIEMEIDRLINLLDLLDADPDLENDGNDEPSLGATEHQAGSWIGVSTMCGDREQQCDDEGAIDYRHN